MGGDGDLASSIVEVSISLAIQKSNKLGTNNRHEGGLLDRDDYQVIFQGEWLDGVRTRVL